MTKVNTGGNGSGRRKSLVPDAKVQDERHRIFGKKNVPLGEDPTTEAIKEKPEYQIEVRTLQGTLIFDISKIALYDTNGQCRELEELSDTTLGTSLSAIFTISKKGENNGK
jgi:hypothetical protein